MMPMIAFFLVPVLFYFLGFFFRKNSNFHPLTFILMTMILGIACVVMTFGSQLFLTMSFFVDAMCTYVSIYFVFAIIGVLTENVFNIVRTKIDSWSNIIQLLILLAMMSTFILVAFSAQYFIIMMF